MNFPSTQSHRTGAQELASFEPFTPQIASSIEENENLACGICLDDYATDTSANWVFHNDARGNGKKHPFHASCIKVWTAQKLTCPTCHITVKPNQEILKENLRSRIFREVNIFYEQTKYNIHQWKNQATEAINSYPEAIQLISLVYASCIATARVQALAPKVVSLAIAILGTAIYANLASRPSLPLPDRHVIPMTAATAYGLAYPRYGLFLLCCCGIAKLASYRQDLNAHRLGNNPPSYAPFFPMRTTWEPTPIRHPQIQKPYRRRNIESSKPFNPITFVLECIGTAFLFIFEGTVSVLRGIGRIFSSYTNHKQ